MSKWNLGRIYGARKHSEFKETQHTTYDLLFTEMRAHLSNCTKDSSWKENFREVFIPMNVIYINLDYYIYLTWYNR